MNYWAQSYNTSIGTSFNSRYGGRFDFSMITFQKIQEGAYGAIPWMIGCAVLGIISLIILGSAHHTLFHTNCLPNWDSKGTYVFFPKAK